MSSLSHGSSAARVWQHIVDGRYAQPLGPKRRAVGHTRPGPPMLAFETIVY
jgi:hypothetical protein